MRGFYAAPFCFFAPLLFNIIPCPYRAYCTHSRSYEASLYTRAEKAMRGGGGGGGGGAPLPAVELDAAPGVAIEFCPPALEEFVWRAVRDGAGGAARGAAPPPPPPLLPPALAALTGLPLDVAMGLGLTRGGADTVAAQLVDAAVPTSLLRAFFF